jgi:poly(3-hydroxybutyrate) depolymerase
MYSLSPTLAIIYPLALAASSGCGTPLPSRLTPGKSTYNVTISSKSVIGTTTERQYILHLPSTFQASNNKAAPLVIAFHGQQQHAWSMEAISELSNPDFNPSTIVAYPEGMDVQAPGVSSYYQHGPSRWVTSKANSKV